MKTHSDLHNIKKGDSEVMFAIDSFSKSHKDAIFTEMNVGLLHSTSGKQEK